MSDGGRRRARGASSCRVVASAAALVMVSWSSSSSSSSLARAFRTPPPLSRFAVDVRDDRSLFIVERATSRSLAAAAAADDDVDADASPVVATRTTIVADDEDASLREDETVDDSVVVSSYASSTAVVLALLFLVTALSALDRVAMSVAMLPLSAELSLTDSDKGDVASAFSSGYALAIVPAGLAASAASPRAAMAAGVATWSAATLLAPGAAEFAVGDGGSLWPLLAARGAVGAAEAVVLPTAQRLQSAWVAPSDRGAATAIVFGGFQTGTVAAYSLSPLVMELGGWRTLFEVYGALGLAFLIPWWCLARDAPPSSETTSIAIDDDDDDDDDRDCLLTNTGLEDDASLLVECSPPIAVSTDKASTSWSVTVAELRGSVAAAPWRGFAASPGVWAIAAAHAANNWGLYNNLSWAPTFYAETYGLDVRDSAALSLLPSVAGAAGGALSGLLADRYVLPRLGGDATTARRLFQGVALLGPALCLGTLSAHLPESPDAARASLTAAIGLQSFNAAGYGPATQEKAGPRWAGLLYSVTSLPGVLLGTLGVWSTGRILDRLHDAASAHPDAAGWSAVFALNACVDVAGAAAFVALYDSEREFE